MIKGRTKSGFPFSIKEEALDDIELIEDLIAMDKGDVTRYPDVVKKLLGDGQKKRLYNHVRNEHGTAPASAVAKEIADILAYKRVKNESSSPA